MSLSFSFCDNKFELNKLNLPSRYYYFNDSENYIKLLNIGEGIFPKDRIKTSFKLVSSSLILTTESATKIYPSKDKNFSLNAIKIDIKDSNLEFINDELILYKDAKFVQSVKYNLCENSTLFYTDILSSGRSFENFDFSYMKIKNSFYIDGVLEYKERFDVEGDFLKDYMKRREDENYLFAKIYIKTFNNEQFLNSLYLENFQSFSYSKSKKLLIGVLSSKSMNELKKEVNKVWNVYRKNLQKDEFSLGKN